MSCASIQETIELIEAGVLFAPPSFVQSSIEELEEICNGCGAANAKFDFVPDTMWGLCVCSCCHIHDKGYDEGETLEDKQESDRIMLNNNLRLIERVTGWKKILKPLMRRRALKYYEMVTTFGGPAFWEGKNV